MTSDVQFAVEGHLGRVTLNRPQAINALTQGMVATLARVLDEWEGRLEISTILLEGAGAQGLCAGADVRILRASALTGGAAALRFWRDEYALVRRIARYPKPVVAIMDGVVMGGGVGLSGHARHRVATERLVWAMPEVAIGFCPDVGGTLLLSRAPGQMGMHLALTASRIGARDALDFGFTDHFVGSGQVGALTAALRECEAVDAIAAAVDASGDPPPAQLSTLRGEIDSCYAGDDLESIVERLQRSPVHAMREAAVKIARGSPIALKVTVSALRRAERLESLEACLAAEFLTSSAFLDEPDFAEGIRAALVDRDLSPRWQPATLQWIQDAMVRARLAGRPGLLPLWEAEAAPATTVT